MNSECDVRHHVSIDKMWVTFTLNWQKTDTRERTGSLFLATQKFPFSNNIQSAYNESKSFLCLSFKNFLLSILWRSFIATHKSVNANTGKYFTSAENY